MNAFIINQYGLPTVLKATQVSTPLIEPKEVLIKVSAAGLNPLDYKIRKGDLKKFARLSFPQILGSDVAGTVAGVGSEVTKFQPDDEVYALLPMPRFGGYAEFVAIDAKCVALKPKNLSFTEAASFPAAALTAWQALRKEATISRDSRVLINGASGGVGSFAVQIAKAAGAQVTGVCSASNIPVVKELGATEVLDYKTQDFTQLPQQYDIILDATGNRSFAECKSVLRKNGTYVTTAFSFKNLLRSKLSFIGGKKGKLIMLQPSQEDLYQLAQFAEAGMIKPVIQKEYNATEKDLVEAHQQLESGHTTGKLVMKINFPNSGE